MAYDGRAYIAQLLPLTQQSCFELSGLAAEGATRARTDALPGSSGVE
jgi:hypothetical protein